MTGASTLSATHRFRLELLQELIQESLGLWELNAHVVTAGSAISIVTDRHVVSVRYDPQNPIAAWWVEGRSAGSTECSREKPRASCLGVLGDIRRLLMMAHG